MESNMVKNIIFFLIVVGVLFLGYRWWQARQAAEVAPAAVEAIVVTEDIVPTTEPATTEAPVTEAEAATPAAEPVAQVTA